MANGATHAANYRTADFVDTVKQATDGKGVDVIIDLVSVNQFFLCRFWD
jgi:NADPH2:quinone reductase